MPSQSTSCNALLKQILISFTYEFFVFWKKVKYVCSKNLFTIMFFFYIDSFHIRKETIQNDVYPYWNNF